jgi:hypothetical protein
MPWGFRKNVPSRIAVRFRPLNELAALKPAGPAPYVRRVIISSPRTRCIAVEDAQGFYRFVSGSRRLYTRFGIERFYETQGERHALDYVNG